jgi:hypothetical protein
MALEPIVVPWPLGEINATYTPSQTQNKRTHTFKLQVRFEPMTVAFERAKTVHIIRRGHCDRINIRNK